MRAFISWSGDRSHRVAGAIHRWIGTAFPSLDPWLSSDMEKGIFWATKLLDGLSTSIIGILCVTAEAKHDWMAFEAGALLDPVDTRTLIALLIDPDPAQLAASPIKEFAGFAADARGLRELAIHLSEHSGDPMSDERADELSERLLRDIAAIGTAQVRDFELSFVLPEGSHSQPFSPLRDMEWLPAINGIVAALRRDLALTIKDYDFATFSYLDMRKAEWLPLPKWISSILTDQLAVIHPTFVEAWYGNAKIAKEVLASSFLLDVSLKARDRRERIWPDSAFLYAFYLLQLPDPHLRHGEIVNLLRQIQELPGIPRGWMYEVPVRFLTNPDLKRLEKDLGSAPRLVAQVVSLGFSYASIRDAISFLGVSVTMDQIRRVVAQFRQELHAVAPPKRVEDKIVSVLDVLMQAEKQEELVMSWKSLQTAVLSMIHWLHEAI